MACSRGLSRSTSRPADSPHFLWRYHGVWDYDFPAAPTLLDVTVHGRKRKAIAQVSKQAFVYVLDRVTGQPIWPIEERPVPASDIPGEELSRTQPFPTQPPAFDRQGVGENDLIDFTPELRAGALDILRHYRHGPLFTPPTSQRRCDAASSCRGRVAGQLSGSGADPETGFLYVPSRTLANLSSDAAAQPQRWPTRRWRGRCCRPCRTARSVKSAPVASPPPIGPRGLPLPAAAHA